MTRRLAWCALLVAAGCGADGGWGDDTPVDAGTSSDAEPPTCDVGVTFMPAAPTAGDTVVASFRITGFKVNPAGEMDVRVRMELRDPGGRVTSEPVDVHLEELAAGPTIYLQQPFKVPSRAPAGTWAAA